MEKEFAELVKEMQESRDLHVVHGGVLSNYVLKGPPKKYKGMLGCTEYGFSTLMNILRFS